MSVSAFLEVPAMVGLHLGFVKLRRGPAIRDYLGLSWSCAKALAGWLALLIIMVVASDALTGALGRPIVLEVMVAFFCNTSVLPLLWAALVIAAPLAEEIMFRGFLFRGWRESRLKGPGTIVLTSALWAVIHLQYEVYGRFLIFLAGLLLGTARLQTGSVLLCMVMHAVMNLIATVEVELFASGR